MAERLSSDPARRVLLVEAGGANASPFVTMPRGFGKLNGDPRYNWKYRAEPTGPANRREYWLRGRGLGGSGAVNGSVWVRGLPQDFDDWAEAGCTGWGWEDMRPSFEAIEDGESGRPPLGVTPHPGGSALCDAFIASARAMGLPVMGDLNTAKGPAIGYQPRSILRGRRRNGASLLAEAKARRNLHVLTGAEALRITFEGRSVTGVALRDTSGDFAVAAGNVVLCAGALNTPKLLMLSGIGPAAVLGNLGIAVVADAPEVGQNLREHRLLSLQYRLRRGSSNHGFRGAGLLASVARYYAARSGPLAQSAFEVGGFIRTMSGPGRPDAQIEFAPLSMDRSTQRLTVEDHPGALCGGYPMRPESTGSLTLTAAAPDTPMTISPGYLTAETDRAVSVGITRFIRALFKRPEMAAYEPQESFPGPEVDSDEGIVAAYHTRGQAGFHAACTCRMGSDARAVVDPQTRVRGVLGLNIADISIMPALVSGNTNAPAMAMAHRAAGLIAASQTAGAPVPVRSTGGKPV